MTTLTWPPVIARCKRVGSEGNNPMFERDERDLCITLSEMERRSRIATNFDQPAALEKMKTYLAADRRFDGYDKDRLVKRVQECRSAGATLDLSDPVLRGGEPRPGGRQNW